MCSHEILWILEIDEYMIHAKTALVFSMENTAAHLWPNAHAPPFSHEAFSQRALCASGKRARAHCTNIDRSKDAQ